MASTSCLQTRRIGLRTAIERALLAALLLITSPARSQAEPGVGIVKLDGAGNAILVSETLPRPDDEVYLQYPGRRSSVRCCKKLTGASFAVAAAERLVATDESGAATPVITKAAIPRSWATMPFVGAAAIGDIRRVVAHGPAELTVVGRRGNVRTVRTCLSTEGFHLVERSAQGRSAVHLYLGLGFEVERPTCRF